MLLQRTCGWIVLCGFAGGLATANLRAQTADPNATPPNPTSAPPAKAGTYAVTQGTVVVAPGLVVPNGNLPWAVDATTDGTPALVPVHHSAITEPANVDADAPNAPPVTHQLEGAHARTVLRGTEPVFIIHANDRTENSGDAGRGNPTGWVLVPASANEKGRGFVHVRFADIALGTDCAAPLVCLKAESLPEGWLRLVPRTPLAAGEYALVPVARQAKPGVVIVYDFAVDPAAALAKDAVVAGAPPAPPAKHHR